MTRVILIALSCSLIAGCYSRLNVTTVTETNSSSVRGQRYSLPVPYLVVTPKPDGTIEHKIEYMPDPEKTYAVSGWSFLATHKLTVDVSERSLLESFTWNKETSGVGKDLLEASAEVKAKRIEAEAAAEVKAAEAAAAAQAADAAVVTAQQELALAEQIYNKMLVAKYPQEIIAEAHIRLITAQQNLELLQSTGDAAADELLGIEKPASAPLRASFDEVYGPIWYQLVYEPNMHTMLKNKGLTGEDVVLLEAMPQKKFTTISIGSRYESLCGTVQIGNINKAAPPVDPELTVRKDRARKVKSLRYRTAGGGWQTGDALKLKAPNAPVTYEPSIPIVIDVSKFKAGPVEIEVIADLESVSGNASCLRGKFNIVDK